MIVRPLHPRERSHRVELGGGSGGCDEECAAVGALPATAPAPPSTATAPAPPSTATAPAPPSTATAPAPPSTATAPAPPSTATAPAPPSTATAPAPPSSTTVLLAGADARRRATLRAELAATLPRRTLFTEAEDVPQALEHACSSRMAFLTGDLLDSGADSLMHLLVRRHPQLTVMRVADEPAHEPQPS